MPLPTISTPTYELTLPSSDKKIKYRPFLVKEEKILILAMESEDTKQIASSIKNVISKFQSGFRGSHGTLHSLISTRAIIEKLVIKLLCLTTISSGFVSISGGLLVRTKTFPN